MLSTGLSHCEQKPAGTYLSGKRRCSQSAGKTSSGPCDNHSTFYDKENTDLTQTPVGSFEGVKGPQTGKEGKSVCSWYNIAKRLAQPVTKKGRLSEAVNKVGSFSLNKYLAESR